MYTHKIFNESVNNIWVIMSVSHWINKNGVTVYSYILFIN